jgi:hypothetical protein
MSLLDLSAEGVRIYYASAPCSSGKTHAFCNLMASANGKEVNGMTRSQLYVAPTLKLVAEVKAQLDRLHVSSIVITHESTERPVRELLETIRTMGSHDAVVLSTHASYFEMPYFHQPENWKVWIDEVPQLDSFLPLRLPRSHRLLGELLSVRPVTDTVGIVEEKEAGCVRDFLDRPRDDLETPLEPLLHSVAHPWKQVFVGLKSWGRVHEQEVVSQNDELNTIYFCSILGHQPFQEATVLAARFEDSLVCDWFRRRGCTTVPDEKVLNLLRFQEYPESLAARVRIHYVLKDRSFSKTFGRRELPGGKGTVLQSMEKEVKAAFGDDEVLLVVNKDYDGSLLESNAFKPIPVKAHGLNQFQASNKVAFLCALNRTPQHAALLRGLGFSKEVIQRSTQYDTLHQCVMRTSLRNREATDPVDIIVPDRQSADYLLDR